MKTLVIANWKCNPTTLQGVKLLVDAIKSKVKGIKRVEVVICPPFVYLSHLLFSTSKLRLGAQDVFWENKGAYTGEVSPDMLKDLGCQYVIVGHSERRSFFGETDEMVNKKVKAAILAGLRPILSVGESLEEREKGKMGNVLKKQITSAFNNVSRSKFQVSGLVIAYEPIWAIGSGKACSPDEAMGAGIFLRRCLGALYSRALAESIPIVYGGSVKASNAASYITQARLQGLLVGGASLDIEEFVKIVKSVSEI